MKFRQSCCWPSRAHGGGTCQCCNWPSWLATKSSWHRLPARTSWLVSGRESHQWVSNKFLLFFLCVYVCLCVFGGGGGGGVSGVLLLLMLFTLICPMMNFLHRKFRLLCPVKESCELQISSKCWSQLYRTRLWALQQSQSSASQYWVQCLNHTPVSLSCHFSLFMIKNSFTLIVAVFVFVV